ncbi:hypothetical protein [Psychrobacter sp. I-STPA10]|uniref:hypothetical protein n=1 Tax=Psychrobacter sp. I-STPA10 TaxID=2585769 RepID=UPI001E3624AC|nr:hypothetical protein [Psychrobacter sp. I-STPA10]
MTLLNLNKNILLITTLTSALLLGACDKQPTESETQAEPNATTEHDAMNHEHEENTTIQQAEDAAAAKDVAFAQAEEIPTDNELDTDNAPVIGNEQN